MTTTKLLIVLFGSVFTFVFTVNTLLYVQNGYNYKVLLLGLWYSLDNFSAYSREYLIAVGAAAVFPIIFALSVLLKRKGIYGDAKFASMTDIKDFGFDMLADKGLILGKKSGKYLRNDDNQSILIVAPQGTGKSAGSIIPMLYSYTGSAIITDFKGELWNTTSKQRAHFSTCKLYAPTLGQEHEALVCFNPLDKTIIDQILAEHHNDFDRVIDYVAKIGSVLFPAQHLQGTEKHFTIKARTLFEFFTAYTLRLSGGTSIPDVYDEILSSPDIKEKIAEVIDLAESTNDSYTVTRGNSLIASADEEFGSFASTLSAKLDAFCTPIIRKSLKKNGFNYTDFRKSSYSLYIYIPTAEIEKMQPILTLLFDYLVGEFLSHDYQKETDQQVTFFLDEFARLGKQPNLVSLPTLGRSYGTRAVYAFQNKGQMTSLYGAEAFAEMLSSSDIKIIYQQNEHNTAEQFSSLIGKTTRKRKSKSRSSSLVKEGGSNSENDEGVPLMLAQDFLNLKLGDVIIVAKGHAERPIKAKSAYWEKEKTMKHLAGYAHNFNIAA